MAERTLAHLARTELKRAVGRSIGPSGVAASVDRHEALRSLARRQLARREIVLVDPSFGDPVRLRAALGEGATLIILPTTGGLRALVQACGSRSFDAAHLFCEGTADTLKVCGEALAPADRLDRAAALRLAGLFARDATASDDAGPALHLYGCPFGRGDTGRKAARGLARGLGVGLAATASRGEEPDAEIAWHLKLTSEVAPHENANGKPGSTRQVEGDLSEDEFRKRRAPRVPGVASVGAGSADAGALAAWSEHDAVALDPFADPLSVFGLAAPDLSGQPPAAAANASAGEPPREDALRAISETPSPATRADASAPALGFPEDGPSPRSIAGDAPPKAGADRRTSDVTDGVSAAERPRVRVRYTRGRTTSDAADPKHEADPQGEPPQPIADPVIDADICAGIGVASDADAPRERAVHEVPAAGPASTPVAAGGVGVELLDHPPSPEEDGAPRPAAALQPRPGDRPVAANVGARGFTVEAVLTPTGDPADDVVLAWDDERSDTAVSLRTRGPNVAFDARAGREAASATSDLTTLGYDDPSAGLLHVAGSVRPDGFVCLHVEGALAATARLPVGGASAVAWPLPAHPSVHATFSGELAYVRLHDAALGGEALSACAAVPRDAPDEAPETLIWDSRSTSAANPVDDAVEAKGERRPEFEAAKSGVATDDGSIAVSGVAGGSEGGWASGSDDESIEPQAHSSRSTDRSPTVREREVPKPPAELEPAAREIDEGDAVASGGSASGDHNVPKAESYDDLEGRGGTSLPKESSGRAIGLPAGVQDGVPTGRPRKRGQDAGECPTESGGSFEPAASQGRAELAPHAAAPAEATPDRHGSLIVARGGEPIEIDVGEVTGCPMRDPIAFWPVSLPSWLALDGATGRVRGTPPASLGGRVPLAIMAANATGAMATLSLAIEVEAASDGEPDGEVFDAVLRTSLEAIPALRALVALGRDAEPERPRPSRVRYRR